MHCIDQDSTSPSVPWQQWSASSALSIKGQFCPASWNVSLPKGEGECCRLWLHVTPQCASSPQLFSYRQMLYKLRRNVFLLIECRYNERFRTGSKCKHLRRTSMIGIFLHKLCSKPIDRSGFPYGCVCIHIFSSRKLSHVIWKWHKMVFAWLSESAVMGHLSCTA